MHDELTAAGRERWQALADEAAHARLVRRARPSGPGRARRGMARALRALAARIDPAGAATARGLRAA